MKDYSKEELLTKQAPPKGSPIFTIPNLLSLVRLLAAPLVFILLGLSDLNERLLALAVLLMVFATDYFDGFLARRLRQQSDLGRMLDPLADKVLVISFLAALVVWRALPLGICLLMLGRDLLILAGGFVIKLKKKIVVESNLWGKASTFILLTAFLLFIFPELELSAWVVLALGIGLAFISLISYAIKFFKVMRS